MKALHCFIVFTATLSLFSCAQKTPKKRTVLAIPVYGQSLASGEQAERITDFDTLSKKSHHLILTENLDEEFGYFSGTHFKQWMKKMLHDRHRAFELSVYSMAEVITNYFDNKGFGDSLMICTFPGGQGASSIVDISKGSQPYQKFLEEIEGAYEKAKSKGWDFQVPAVCWMQGEDDVLWKKSSNYKKDLKTFLTALNKDVKAITKQPNNITCICYQTNCLTLANEFNANLFKGRETLVPQAQLELIRDDQQFMASGPTYPYSFAEDSPHIDGLSQKRLGYLAGLSVIRLLESQQSKGLTPASFSRAGDTVIIRFNVSSPPLVLDTLAIYKAANYGFSIINTSNQNIVQQVILQNNTIKICCKQSPAGCKVRYAVNGGKRKNGYKHGPRGNLRDSQGDDLKATILKQKYPLHNWCYQFDVLLL